MKQLDVPIILASTRGETHACGGRCTGKPRKDGYCYHDGGTKHRIGQCHGHHRASSRKSDTGQARSSLADPGQRSS